MEKYFTFGTNIVNCRFCDKSYRNYSINKRNLYIHMQTQHSETFKDYHKNNWVNQYFVLENVIAKCKLYEQEYKITLPALQAHSLRHKSEIDTDKDKQSKYFYKYLNYFQL